MKKTRDEVFKKKIQERIEKYLRLFEEQEEQGAIWNVKLEGQFVKNKKPKTIEKITRKHFRSFYHAIKLEPVLGEKRALELADTIVNSCSKQIKQLIADEVIGEDEKDQEVTVMKMELTETYLEASTAALCYHARKKLRKQQRKKLERL